MDECIHDDSSIEYTSNIISFTIKNGSLQFSPYALDGNDQFMTNYDNGIANILLSFDCHTPKLYIYVRNIYPWYHFLMWLLLPVTVSNVRIIRNVHINTILHAASGWSDHRQEKFISNQFVSWKPMTGKSWHHSIDEADARDELGCQGTGQSCKFNILSDIYHMHGIVSMCDLTSRPSQRQAYI